MENSTAVATERQKVVAIASVTNAIKNLELQYTAEKISRSEYEEKALEIGETIRKGEEFYGDSDDFHNLAVSFSRLEKKEIATMIIEKGLKKYPYSVDLLADFLKYGMECGKDAECAKYFERLSKLPDIKMTWRGYDFAVDYLLEKMRNALTQEEAESYKNTIDDIIVRYKERFPSSEDPYMSEASVLSYLGKDSEAIDVLKMAIDKLAAPKCCLKYADMMIERGNYDEVIKTVQRGISVSAQEQPGISIPYLFYLSGLAKDAKIHADAAYDDKERIEDAYSDYRVAQTLFGTSKATYLRNLMLRIKILELKSGIEYGMV